MYHTSRDPETSERGGQETWNISRRTRWPSFFGLFLQARGGIIPLAPLPGSATAHISIVNVPDEMYSLASQCDILDECFANRCWGTHEETWGEDSYLHDKVAKRSQICKKNFPCQFLETRMVFSYMSNGGKKTTWENTWFSASVSVWLSQKNCKPLTSINHAVAMVQAIKCK